MGAVKRRFSESFKREAVDRVATSGLSAGAVAIKLGLHETVLQRWMMQFGTRATGQARAPTRKRRPRRRLIWSLRIPAEPQAGKPSGRTIGFGWSATS